MLSALKGTLKAAWQLEKLSAGEYHRAIDMKTLENESFPAGREIKAGELSALIEACIAEDSSSRTKDATIIALLYAGSLRRTEVVALNLSDHEVESGKLIVRGKGRKERIVWVNNGAAAALADWLSICGNEAGPLFVPVNKGGNLEISRLTHQAIYKMLKKRAEQANVRDFTSRF
jgi:site-specific recombinase XerD